MTNPALLDSTIRNQIYLERLKANQVQRFTKFLKKIDRDLRDRLTREDLTEFSRTRLQTLLVSVNKNLNETFNRFQEQLDADLDEIGVYEAEFEARSLENALDQDGFESIVPASNQVHAAIYSTPLSVRGSDGGKLLQPFVKDWSKKDRARIIGAIRQGFFEGQTNFQIIQALRGTKARNYQDGVLGVVGRNAEAIVRTAVQHVASVARFETWNKNPEVVKGYEWVSTLDSKTTTVCKGLDGQTFKMGKGPKPPAHIRCRSTTVAVLDPKYDFLKEGQTRASRGPDGKTRNVADQEYFEWLQKQPPEFQDDALGPVRGKLFRDGGLSAKQFKDLQLDKKFKPLTLEEMRKKEPNAFKKAFGDGPLRGDAKPKATPKSSAGVANEWHTSSFAGARQAVKRVANDNLDIDVINNSKKSAYAQGGSLINMPRDVKTRADYQNTWRHEFGHIIDFRRGGSPWGYASSRSAYRTAMKTDGENLKPPAGKGRRKGEIKKAQAVKAQFLTDLEDKLTNFESESRLRTQKDRIAFNKKLAKDAGLDYDKLTKLLDDVTGESDFGTLGGAHRLARVIGAIERRDAEEFYNFASMKYLGDPVINRKVYEYDGWLGSFSDMVGASTRNGVCSFHNRFPGHTDSYYAQSPFFAPTETFANMTATYGHKNKYAWEIVERFFPNLTKQYLEIWNEN